MHTSTLFEKVLLFVCGFGALQGILLAGFVYFNPKVDKTVNKFLAGYIICIALVMTFPFFIRLMNWYSTFWISPLPLLAGPLLYLYLRSFKETVTWQKALPHMALFVVVGILTWWNMNVFSNLYPSSQEVPTEVLHSTSTILLQAIKPVQGILYYFLARKTLNIYQRSIRHLFSDTSRIDLQWARFLINGFLLLTVMYMICFPLMLRFPGQFNTLLLINLAVGTLYIYMATYKGIIQHTIWQALPGVDRQKVEQEMHEAEEFDANAQAFKTAKPKTLRSGNDGRLGELVRKITRLMEDDKLYQEAELTLQQVADRLEVPSYQVSQALNEGMKKSFYELVNGYRVEDAKRLLLDERQQNHTILSVGFEAGFNSKTTFNTVFKKFTGLTPSEFRDRERVLQTTH